MIRHQGLTSNEDSSRMEEMIDSDCEEDYEEMNDEIQNIQCLFCDYISNSLQDAIKHMKIKHNFDFIEFKILHSLDDYSYRKVINFIRKNQISPDELKKLNRKSWDCDDYLKPFFDDDAWLMIDVDEFGDKKVFDGEYSTNLENGSLSSNFVELQNIIQNLKSQLEQQKLETLHNKQHIEEMTNNAQKFMLEDENMKTTKDRVINSLGDQGYFNSYSHFAIHHEMLTDRIRTESYRDALIANSNMFNNKIILDLGCGTGILSMFAAKTGCKKVFSVDQSDIIYHAMDIIRENNLSHMIELKKGRLEDIEIGVEKVDAIVSEWMGYFLLFEGMLDSVIYARDHYLSPGGKLLPNRCSISIIGSGDTKRYVELVDYWSNVYGFKMSCMKAEVVREPSVEICNANHLITTASEIQSFDLYTVSTDCVNFSSPFELRVKRTGSLTAIIGYFDIFFDLDNPVHFSTGPTANPTHWKQTVFSLSEPLSITEGEIINGKIIVRRHIKDIRGIIVTIWIKNSSQTYYLD